MTVKNHLLLLRVLRVVFFGLGLAVILPQMEYHGTMGFADALPLLGGLALMFAPYLVLSHLIPARCPKCGGRAFLKAEWTTGSMSQPEEVRVGSRIGSFRWKCHSCGHVETQESSVIDNLIPPFVS
jgi:DNA-directed RNA polymerase subunit RPC12/RpoP